MGEITVWIGEWPVDQIIQLEDRNDLPTVIKLMMLGEAAARRRELARAVPVKKQTSPIIPAGPMAISDRDGLDLQRRRTLTVVDEYHYSPAELAEKWGWSVDTIREMFREEPGVLLMGKPSRRVGRALKRSYFTMQIPESVALRVHQRLGTRKRR